MEESDLHGENFPGSRARRAISLQALMKGTTEGTDPILHMNCEESFNRSI